MAAATRPGPADARVPCPLCGGLIHPIAGRCKHCKGDLRSLRSARPAAGATLPALNGAAHPQAAHPQAAHLQAAHPQAAPVANGHAPANGYHPPAPTRAAAPAPQGGSLVHAVAAAAPLPLLAQHGPADAVPILPPRPTGRLTAPAPRASWKSWPVIVIILAVIAIVTAVVLMLFPPGGAKDEGTHRSLQPAPDRMDTNPAPATPRKPPSTSPDPWSRRGGGSASSPAPDDPDIDDPDVDDAVSTRDPFSRRGGLGTPGRNMLYSMVKHACARLTACGTTSSQTKLLCDSYGRYPSMTPPSCPAAARCLRSIDEMSCDVTVDDAMGLLQLKDKLPDCEEALSC